MSLNRSRFALFEHENQTHSATVEQGTKLDDIVKPEFWAHVSTLMRPYDKIIVRWDDGIQYAELLVLACSRTFARVKIMFHVDLETSDVDQTTLEQQATHEIRWRGPVLKWSIIRKTDSAVIREGIEGKDIARQELESYMKALG